MSRSRSLRTWMDWLQQQGRVQRVSRPVNLQYELAAVIKKLDGQSAVRFEHPGGHAVPLVAGICSRREDFAEAIGTDVPGLIHTFAKCQANPGTPTLIPSDAAPVHEVVLTEGIDLLKLFPIPTHHGKDGGPYITSAIFVVRDPQTGWHNLSIHRLHVIGPNRLGALLLPRHAWMQFAAAERAGRPLEVAVVVGVDPVLLLASQATTPAGVSEYGIAAAMLGETPLELVKGVTVDVQVPAHAEIVLEGRLLPSVREDEGPFGEFPRYYGPKSPKPVVEITAVTHRKNPIWQTILAAGMEHLLLGAIPKEAHMYEMVRQTVPTVRSVHLTPGGTCRYHAVVQITKTREGEAKNAAFAALASSMDIKHVTVVDDDVDIFDPNEVEWAVATRVQADRDVFIVTDALGSKLDPSTRDGLSAKMAIDATVPVGSRLGREGHPGTFERIQIPDLEKICLEDYLDKE